MKRFLVVCLAFAMIFTFSACGDDTTVVSSVEPPVSSEDTEPVSTTKTVVPNESDVLVGGRSYEFNTLAWAGATFEFQCTGTTVGAVISGQRGNFEVAIDKGAYTSYTIKNGTHEYIFAEGLSEGTHTVRILRTNDPWSPAFTVDSLILSSNAEIVEGYTGDYKLKIEFVGDSLTSGLGVKHSQCYTTITSNLLNAHFQVVSKTSKGLYIDAHYEDKGGLIKLYQSTIDGGAQDKPYTYDADLVVLNIGANDAGNLLFEMTDEQKKKDYMVEFDRRYTEILEELLISNPNASILCTYGQVALVRHPELEQIIADAVEEFKVKHPDVKIDIFVFQAMFDEAEGHPGPLSHQRDAQSLAMKIKKFLEL